MPTSGNANFLPDVGEIAEEAFDRAGVKFISGEDLRSARRSLDIMLLEWANRGINLWCVSETNQSLTADDGNYTASSDAVSILEAVLRTDDGDANNQLDYELQRIPRTTWMGIPSKLTTGRPSQIYIDRQQGSITLNLWPVPDSSDYNLVYTYIRRIEDTGPGGTYDADVPDRFIPALIAGLAFNIALKRPEAAPRIDFLKSNYEEQFQLAAAEDREKTSFFMRPGGI